MLPGVEALARDQRGCAGHGGGLPDDEIRLIADSSAGEIRVPVDAGSLHRKIRALPGIILLEDVGGVGVGSPSLGHSGFKREDVRGAGVGIGDAGDFQNRRDVFLVLGAQFGHLRRRVEIIVALKHSEAALRQVRIIAFRVVETLIHEQTEDVVGAGGEAVDFGVQRAAEIRGQGRFVSQRCNRGHFIGDGREAFGLDAVDIHEAGEVVANFLGVAAFRNRVRGGVLNQVAHALAGFFGQDRAIVVAASAGGLRRGFQPAAVGVAVEIVARPNGAIHAVIRGSVVGSLLRRRVPRKGRSANNDEQDSAKESHGSVLESDLCQTRVASANGDAMGQGFVARAESRER